MPSASRPAFLRRLVGASARSRKPDGGDMGTALGLDQSLEEDPEHDGCPTAEPPVRPVVRVASWRLWLGRKLGS